MNERSQWRGAAAECGAVADAVELLSSICWHDSVLYRVELGRENSCDEVTLRARLLTSAPTISVPTTLVFLDCLAVTCDMNWNVHCMSDGEMIDDASASLTDPLLDRVRECWAQIPGVSLGAVAAFRLDLASTGSSVALAFRRMRIQPTGAPSKHTAPPGTPREALRSQTPMRTRLREADLLLAQGRIAEAAVIYDLVAAEFEGTGFSVKAVAVAKQLCTIAESEDAALQRFHISALERLVRLYRILDLQTDAEATQRQPASLRHPT